MEDKSKSILCLAAAVIMIIIGFLSEVTGYGAENMILGWFGVFLMGFGWYARGAIIKLDASRGN